MSEMRQYRVLMLAPTSFFADYGCHVRILEEVTTLQTLGHDVAIATYHNGNPVAGLDIRRTLPLPWRRHYLVGSSRQKLLLDALLGLKVFGLLASGRFDIIHAHLHEGALIGLVMGRLFRVPVVFDFQGSLTGEMVDHHFLKAQSRSFRFFRRLETWIDRHSTVILASSRNAQQLLHEELGSRSDRVQVLPDCVSAVSFRPANSYSPEELASLRAELGIPTDRRLIVYLGLLAEYQGIGLLLEALEKVLAVRQDVHLLLMGFPNEEVYRSRARELGIDDHITFTGRISYPQAPRHLALGDVAVAPKMSLTEGAGKLLNYMAVGLPVVAFDTPVAREYLGGDGIFAEPGDAASLGHQLLMALFPQLAGSAGRPGAGARLRQRAIKLFSWDRAGQQLVQVYQNLLGDTPNQAATASRYQTTSR